MRALFSLLALLPVTLLQAAEIPLYPTGPSEDSAFLRFFNAGQTALELSAANGASLRLEGDVRASDFLTVPAGKPIKGTLKQANAYVKFLYTPEAQTIIAENYFRPIDPTVAAKYAKQYPKVNLFTIDEVFGGWAKAQKTHFADGGSFDKVYTRK